MVERGEGGERMKKRERGDSVWTSVCEMRFRCEVWLELGVLLMVDECGQVRCKGRRWS